MRSELFKSVFAMIVVVGSVGAGVATVVACSGSSTGTGSPEGGTTSGSSGTSGSMKGILGGGAGGATSVPTTCTPSSSDDPCTACLKQQCCSQTVACGTSAECSAIITCAGSCDSSSSTCIQSCVDAHPSGQSLVSDLVNCEEGTTCKSTCEGTTSTSGGTSGTSGGTSGTSGGTSGSSGTPPPGCLQDPPDPTLCQGVTGKPVSHDCPAGPPSTSCVAQPQMLSGIWCCPS